MRIFKTSWFERFARKNEIEDRMLSEAVERIQRGLVDADLGNGVIKQRLARIGQGRSKGYRVVLLVREVNMCFLFMDLPKAIKAISKKMKKKPSKN